MDEEEVTTIENLFDFLDFWRQETKKQKEFVTQNSTNNLQMVALCVEIMLKHCHFFHKGYFFVSFYFFIFIFCCWYTNNHISQFFFPTNQALATPKKKTHTKKTNLKRRDKVKLLGNK